MKNPCVMDQLMGAEIMRLEAEQIVTITHQNCYNDYEFRNQQQVTNLPTDQDTETYRKLTSTKRPSSLTNAYLNEWDY